MILLYREYRVDSSKWNPYIPSLAITYPCPKSGTGGAKRIEDPVDSEEIAKGPDGKCSRISGPASVIVKYIQSHTHMMTGCYTSDWKLSHEPAYSLSLAS